MSPYCRIAASRCRAFVVGFNLAVLLARGIFPLNGDDHWQVRGLPGGACTEAIDGLGHVLVALLTALGIDVWLEEGDRHDV